MRNFEHSVNVLVKAYFDGTLEHGDCAKCAVGNIVQESTGLPVGGEYQPIDGTAAIWKALFFTQSGRQIIRPQGFREYFKEAIAAVRMTGYTIQELAKIEFAFETADTGQSTDDWMFNGLMAVVDALADIHGIDLSQKEQSKALFVK